MFITKQDDVFFSVQDFLTVITCHISNLGCNGGLRHANKLGVVWFRFVITKTRVMRISMASKDAILNVSDVTLMISQKYKVLITTVRLAASVLNTRRAN